MKPSLVIILERARTILKNALHYAISETQLPAFLIEGILLDLLNDIREQKAKEITAEFEKVFESIPSSEEGPVKDKTGGEMSNE